MNIERKKMLQSYLKNTMLSLEEQQNIQHTHTGLVEATNKERVKQFSKPMDAQEFQDPGKVLVVWIKNLSGISMKPKDSLKLDFIEIDKPKTYSVEEVLLEYDYTDIHISLVNNMKIKK